MARASKVSISINMKQVPLIGETYRIADEGCIPGAAFRNLDYAEADTTFTAGIDYNLKMLAFDAQTSGGLLISVPEKIAGNVLSSLLAAGLAESSIIGHVTGKEDKYLLLED
jgi:selenide,water dikinase